jgi:Bacterial RNA polymerase, alpha chain C terminal domain
MRYDASMATIDKQIRRLERSLKAHERLRFAASELRAFNLSIDALELPPRITNDLRAIGVNTIRELLVTTERRLIFDTPTIEQQSLKIIAASFARVGIGSDRGLSWWKKYASKPGANPKSLQDIEFKFSATEKNLVAQGLRPTAAAREAGVHHSTVCRAINRRYTAYKIALREACQPANPPK